MFCLLMTFGYREISLNMNPFTIEKDLFKQFFLAITASEQDPNALA